MRVMGFLTDPAADVLRSPDRLTTESEHSFLLSVPFPVISNPPPPGICPPDEPNVASSSSNDVGPRGMLQTQLPFSAVNTDDDMVGVPRDRDEASTAVQEEGTADLQEEAAFQQGMYPRQPTKDSELTIVSYPLKDQGTAAQQLSANMEEESNSLLGSGARSSSTNKARHSGCQRVMASTVLHLVMYPDHFKFLSCIQWFFNCVLDQSASILLVYVS